MKTLETCTVCNHGKFHNEPCRHCLGLTKVKPDPIVMDYTGLTRAHTKPKWLEKPAPRPRKTHYMGLSDTQKRHMVSAHKRVMLSRLRAEYGLTEMQAGMVLDGWRSENGLPHRIRNWKKEDVVERMGSALQHLYDKYGKYQRPGS